MSLLQISEPGESTVKEACAVRAIGIDLGTTNSLVAYVEDGEPVVVKDEQGGALIPSVVHYGADGGVLVGTQARALAADHPGRTVCSPRSVRVHGCHLVCLPVPPLASLASA